MLKTLGAATLALGTCALAGFSANASAAYVFSNDGPGDASIAGMPAINQDLPSPPPPPAIPEPASAAPMMAGLATLFAAVRRRKSD